MAQLLVDAAESGLLQQPDHSISISRAGDQVMPMQQPRGHLPGAPPANMNVDNVIFGLVHRHKGQAGASGSNTPVVAGISEEEEGDDDAEGQDEDPKAAKKAAARGGGRGARGVGRPKRGAAPPAIRGAAPPANVGGNTPDDRSGVMTRAHASELILVGLYHYIHVIYPEGKTPAPGAEGA